MPRRPPRRLPTARYSKHLEPSTPIAGLSSKVIRQITEAEHQRPYGTTGDTARAITTLKESLRQPSHALRYGVDCPCCDPREALEVLHAIMRLLPTPARRQMIAIVEPLSELYERRTLPDPSAPAELPWWQRRIRER
jgi:phage terminase large subunit GpA-like protein